MSPRALRHALQYAVTRHRSEAALAHLAAIVEASGDAIFRCAPDATVLSWNRSAERIFGLAAPQAVGQPFLTLFSAAQGAEGRLLLDRLRRGGPPEELEAHLVGRGGATVHLSIGVSPIRDRGGRMLGAAVVARDVTRSRELEAEVVALSLHDELTGLLNRRGFVELCEQQMKVARRNGRPLMFLYLDLDRLKTLNDSFGHGEGDRALRATAAILKESFRETSIIGRLGGDEFAVLVVDADPASAPGLLQRLRRSIDRFNATASLRGPLSVSTGTAVTDPLAPGSLQRLWAEADAAMYEAKRRMVDARSLLASPGEPA
jgi:diguanylate cyclase (GGDEF)-like protein/PAS domain S-box-containing protein